MILAYKQQAGHEGTENLSKDVMRYFFPRKALPYRETYRNSGIEMASRCCSTGYDSKRDADSVCPTDLKERPKNLEPSHQYFITVLVSWKGETLPFVPARFR